MFVLPFQCFAIIDVAILVCHDIQPGFKDRSRKEKGMFSTSLLSQNWSKMMNNNINFCFVERLGPSWNDGAMEVSFWQSIKGKYLVGYCTTYFLIGELHCIFILPVRASVFIPRQSITIPLCRVLFFLINNLVTKEITKQILAIKMPPLLPLQLLKPF